MSFLDSDVKKPLASVAAMNDEGNSVVFSKMWGNYIVNDRTGIKIQLERVGETFEMVLKTKKLEMGTKKDLKWIEDGGKKWAGMEVDANKEESVDEEGARRIDGRKERWFSGGGCWNGSELRDGAAA